MLSVFIVLASLVAVVWIIAQASGRGWPRPPVWRAGLRLGITLGIARLAFLWLAITLLMASTGWRQTPGHIVLVADAVVEMSLAKGWLQDPVTWKLGLTALVSTTSLALGQIAAYLGSRLRRIVATLPE